MKRTKLTNGKQAVEIIHRCGHAYTYSIPDNRGAAFELHQNVALHDCPVCTKAMEQTAKDGGETVEHSADGFEHAQEAVAMFLACIDDKYEGARVTLIDDSQIEERPDGTVRLTINCVVR